jgi:hypothetical protein
VRVWFVEKFLPKGRIEVSHVKGPGSRSRIRQEIYASEEGWAVPILAGSKVGETLMGIEKGRPSGRKKKLRESTPGYQIWSKEDDAYLMAHAGRESWRTIGYALGGRSSKAIAARANILRLKGKLE